MKLLITQAEIKELNKKLMKAFPTPDYNMKKLVSGFATFSSIKLTNKQIKACNERILEAQELLLNHNN